MTIYLGLGSNLGDRHEHLRTAIGRLQRIDPATLRVSRISPVVESPALLPDGAPADWNRPYLNLAVECETASSPDEIHALTVGIESDLGRPPRGSGHRWAPRSIDIDILLWGERVYSTPDLTIPHRELHRRSFVLAPLIALQPRLTIPGKGSKTLLEWSAELPHHIPLWMGIVNVTPDSFSDGGRFSDWASVEPHVDGMVASGVHILDVGAQSTRPGGEPIDAREEWARLEPVLRPLVEKFSGRPLRPVISVDTYFPQVAERALDLGVGMINDVGGLSSTAMIDLARSSGADWVAMHQLTLPADPGVTLPPECDPVAEVDRWLRGRLEAWQAAGLDLDRIVVDPGIGFGKDPLQSLKLLRRAGELRKHGLRTLVGHSRKSFMNDLLPAAAAGEEIDPMRARDLATIGASLELCRQGVDILRVHNVRDSIAAYKGWAHLVS